MNTNDLTKQIDKSVSGRPYVSNMDQYLNNFSDSKLFEYLKRHVSLIHQEVPIKQEA